MCVNKREVTVLEIPFPFDNKSFNFAISIVEFSSSLLKYLFELKVLIVKIKMPLLNDKLSINFKVQTKHYQIKIRIRNKEN